MRVVSNKKLMLGTFVFFSMVLFLGIVFATTTMNSPVSFGNYSTTLNFTATTDLTKPLNVTIYYNSTGGAAGTNSELLLTIVNTSASQTVFTNATIDISSLDDLSTYNFSAYADNGTDQEFSVSVANVTIDNTAPNVTLLTIPASSATYSGSIVLNVTVNDILVGMDTVFFNITNSTGSQNATYTATASGIYYNTTVNTTTFLDGTYNITVWANDSLNSLNNSIVASNVVFDNTAPVVTLTSSDSSTTSLTIAIGVTDATATTCTSSRGDSSISGTTLTESGLSCGNSYSYIVTCTDAAGNSGASSLTSFRTSSCLGGSSSVDGWTTSFSLLPPAMYAGSSRIMRKNQRTKFVFGGVSHYVGIKNISSSVVNIEVASTPVSYNFLVGDERKVDLDEDGIYDLYIKLNSTDGFVSNVFIKLIEDGDSFENVVGMNQEVAADNETEEVVGDESTGVVDDKISKGGYSWIIWLLALVVIVIVGILVFLSIKKKSKVKKKR